MSSNYFQLEQRGQMQIKGKGLMVTYWLLGEELTRLESSTEVGFPSQCGRSIRRSHISHLIEISDYHRVQVQEEKLCVRPGRVSSHVKKREGQTEAACAAIRYRLIVKPWPQTPLVPNPKPRGLGLTLKCCYNPLEESDFAGKPSRNKTKLEK